MVKWFFSTPDPPEFNNTLPELLCSDEDSGNEDVLDMEYTDTEAEDLKRNAEVGGSSTARQHYTPVEYMEMLNLYPKGEICHISTVASIK